MMRWPIAKIMRLFIAIYARGCILIFRPFIQLKCKDMRREYLPNPGIIIMNHCSFFDTYLGSMLPIFDVHICLRSWPFRMFWYSTFMRLAEYLDMEKSSFDEILASAGQVVRNGRFLLIFPEGHRSRTGKPGRFYSGAFKLAVQLKVPILPLCVSGTHTLMPPSRWWVKPATIEMQLLEPVYPDKYSGEMAHKELCNDVCRQMTEVIERMEDKKTSAN